MVRFAWRADIGKKAKIMVSAIIAGDFIVLLMLSLFQQRKVKFPQEFDALDLATDDLREKLLPASRKLKDIEKERGERRKVRKRTKQAAAAAGAGPSTSVVPSTADVEMGDASGIATTTESTAVVEGEDKTKQTVLGEFEDEVVVRKREAAELETLISPQVKADVGASATGLYELVGE